MDIDFTLEQLADNDLLRSLRTVTSAAGPEIEIDGRRVLLMCSNDYLGLADHPKVTDAACEAAGRWGAGAGASRLVSGNLQIHEQLEDELAAFKGKERALLFGSGYMANCGVISSLAGDEDCVFSDELNHASIVDGCRLSRAETFVYRHGDLEHLAWGLAHCTGKPSLIVTDGVFSMDGDIAPLEEIVQLAKRYGTRVCVDEAHATGVYGPGGRGTVAAAGLEEEIDIVIGTLGKALGSYGAYAACSDKLRLFFVNRARSAIFTTAPPPPSVGAALAALDLIRSEPHLQATLRSNARLIREKLRLLGVAASGKEEIPIVPIEIGDAARTVAVCERALNGGAFAQAIRPPTVPVGSSRLRLTVSAAHDESQLARAAEIFAEATTAVCRPGPPVR